ncbi:DoxX family protein [Marinobacter mobilis]|uniref:Putative oxidoreductase n=2 Tax=Marinobacter mobilis TaxID=488533 RepID=A0A1H2SJF3_9GAMM|nr:putative oxidoreductase [Marinobacter mobilis]
MSDVNRSDWAALILRVLLGLVMLAHSLYLKLLVFTLAGTAQFFESLGLPAVLAYLVFGVEAVAGVMLLLGYRVRLAALALLPILVGATWAHAGNGWLFTNAGGGWEYPVVLAMLTWLQFLLGGGVLALDSRTPARGAVCHDASAP